MSFILPWSGPACSTVLCLIFLQKTDVPVWKKLYNNVDELLVGDLQEIVNTRVAKGDIIFINEKSWLKDIRAYSPHACNLAMGKDSFSVQRIAFPVRKSFPFKKEFNDK